MKLHLYFVLLVLLSSGRLIGDPLLPPPPASPPPPLQAPVKIRPEFTEQTFAGFLSKQNRAKIGVRVVDESGKLLPGIKCFAKFQTRVLAKWKWKEEHNLIDTNKDGFSSVLKEDLLDVYGTTNEDGIAYIERRCLLDPGLSIHTAAEGYYHSWKSIRLRYDEKGPQDQKLQPYGSVYDLTIKRIINPVPMYVIIQWRRDMPGIGSYGFDMEKNDWVAPHGKGITSDMVFGLEKVGSPEEGRATLTVSFPTQGDGIIPIPELKGGESELRLPREAPAEGYQSKITIPYVWAGGNVPKQTTKAMPGYFIRVRTVLDANGRIVKAWYGKIDDEFRYDLNQNPSASLVLSYHVNPDGTRNLEFDRKKNLLRVGSQGSSDFITP